MTFSKEFETQPGSGSSPSIFHDDTMRNSHHWLYFFALLLALVMAAPSSLHGEEVALSPADLEPLGKAVLNLDSNQMARWIETTGLDSAAPELRGDIVVATWAIACAQNQSDVLKTMQGLAASDPGVRARTESLSEAFDNLMAQSIEVDPVSVMPDMIVIAKQTRRAILVAALRGDKESVHAARASLAEADLATTLKNELILFATACQKLSVQMEGSPLSGAIDQAVRARQQQESFQESLLHWLADFRTDPDGVEMPRGGEANSYTVMVEKEKARAALISSYSQLYTAYVNGEKTRVECIKGMQEVSSAALDLKEKRATMYWTLKKLRSDHLRERREESIAFNQKRSKERQQRSASDYSMTWPGVFQHRDLRDRANSLRANLTDYSPGNSGPLSVVYARCVADIRALNQRLMTDLEGITFAQRATLRSYLRRLENEIKREYSSNGYIASLNSTRLLDTRSLVAGPSSSSDRGDAIRTAKLKLDGDDTDVASFALYRSILVSLVRAGKQGDKERLRALASVIRESDLLKKEHQKSLNAIGSKLYSGDLKLDRAIIVEDPEEVLATIAGVSGDETGALLDVPEDYQGEAFDVLIAAAFDGPGV